MRDHNIEKEMYRQAVALIERRYPAGWGGAGVVHTADGHYFTSVSIDTAEQRFGGVKGTEAVLKYATKKIQFKC